MDKHVMIDKILKSIEDELEYASAAFDSSDTDELTINVKYIDNLRSTFEDLREELTDIMLLEPVREAEEGQNSDDALSGVSGA